MFALRKVINGRISLSEQNLSHVGWYSREAQLPALHSRLTSLCSAAPFRAAEKPSERPSLPEDRAPSGSWNTTPCIPGPGCGQWRLSYGDSVAYFGGQALAWPLCPRAWLKPVCPPGFAWATPGRPLTTLTPPPPHAKTLVTLILRHEKPPLSGLPGRGGGDRCGFLWGGGGLGYINPGGWARPPRRAQVHDCHQDKSNIIKFQSAE